MKVLVTGGAGFIGHHLVSELIRRGDDVAVLDNLSTGARARLGAFRGDVAFTEGDLRDARAVDRAVAGCEVVFHQAALPSVARSVKDPRLTNDVNTSGTIELVMSAARAGVRRIVYAGSSSVYGGSPELPRRERQKPDPRSPYAASKLAGEHYVHTLGAIHGVETVALRYFNIFGPGQDPASEYAAAVPRFVTAGLRDERPTVYGDGHQSRDFTYVDNVTSANLLAAAAEGVSGLTCNIACGERYSVRDLLAAIGAALGRVLDPVFAPERLGDVRHSQADISLARQTLGYEVVVPFKEGVRRTVEWYRLHLG